MSDLQKYIAERKKLDIVFAKNCEEGYERFKTGVEAEVSRIDPTRAGQTAENQEDGSFKD